MYSPSVQLTNSIKTGQNFDEEELQATIDRLEFERDYYQVSIDVHSVINIVSIAYIYIRESCAL